jgi:hypothetical protein
MGTRSRILLRRSSKPHIFLWIHWDGYLEGVGRSLCKQIQSLLSKYTSQQVAEMIESLDVENTDGYQCFNVNELTDFVEGQTSYMNDECDDIQYEYSVDFSKEVIHVKAPNGAAFVWFSQIKDGFDITTLDNLWEMC